MTGYLMTPAFWVDLSSAFLGIGWGVALLYFEWGLLVQVLDQPPRKARPPTQTIVSVGLFLGGLLGLLGLRVATSFKVPPAGSWDLCLLGYVAPHMSLLVKIFERAWLQGRPGTIPQRRGEWLPYLRAGSVPGRALLMLFGVAAPSLVALIWVAPADTPLFVSAAVVSAMAFATGLRRFNDQGTKAG